MHSGGHRASLNYFQATLKPSRLFLHTIVETQPFPSIPTAKLHIISRLATTSFLLPLTNEIFPGTCPLQLLLQRSSAIPVSPCLPRCLSLLPCHQDVSGHSRPGPHLCLSIHIRYHLTPASHGLICPLCSLFFPLPSFFFQNKPHVV